MLKNPLFWLPFFIYLGVAGQLIEYAIEVDKGMVVLDVVHKVQEEHANDLAARWNCKAGKCGSCSV